MQRPGADPNDMTVSDFLCDFCGRAWDGAFPMVEGHQGSLICGSCLTVAWTEVVTLETDAAPAGATCAMCLQEKDDPMWASPVRKAFACRPCVKQAAGRLHKDPDWDWEKPDSGSEPPA